MLRRLCAALFLLLAALPARAANLDVTASYKMRALSYQNLNLSGDKASQEDHSFISNDASLGIAVRNIDLEPKGSEEMTMDVGVVLRALGVTGSTTALQGQPFNRIASNYPSADFTPFLENAYLRVYHFLGYPIEATFGRQNYRLGSGLLLDDDGAGFTGITVKGDLPWWGMKAEGFVFEDRNSLVATQDNADNSLALFGFAVDVPTEGVWQLNQLFERDLGSQMAYGCTYPDTVPNNFGVPYECYVSKTFKSFTDVRYSLNYGPIVFDGEAALEKGLASTTSNPLDLQNTQTFTPGLFNTPPGRITYSGNAEVVRAKWKQSLPRLGEGIARLSVARGSGDDPSDSTRDTAFYPAHGHQFDGLDRSGFGDFFGATPYSAFGGNYGPKGSSTTASGLQQGNSGIVVVGIGYTPPAFRGYVLDVDYFLFQSDRAVNNSHVLGKEWDFRLRYNVQDRFGFAFSAALFTAGSAGIAEGAKAKKYGLTAFGRF
jgi:hypothetical protein